MSDREGAGAPILVDSGAMQHGCPVYQVSRHKLVGLEGLQQVHDAALSAHVAICCSVQRLAASILHPVAHTEPV